MFTGVCFFLFFGFFFCFVLFFSPQNVETSGHIINLSAPSPMPWYLLDVIFIMLNIHELGFPQQMELMIKTHDGPIMCHNNNHLEENKQRYLYMILGGSNWYKLDKFITHPSLLILRPKKKLLCCSQVEFLKSWVSYDYVTRHVFICIFQTEHF